jgi:sulfur relay (sulfurtransferase) DsrF/TusC family protein
VTDPRGPVLLWIRHPPHSTIHLSEAVRVASMATALGIPTRLLFIGEGVRALARGQAPYRYSPPIEKTLQGVVTDEQPALVHLPSLSARGLGLAQLVDRLPIETVDDQLAAEWLVRSHRVVPF